MFYSQKKNIFFRIVGHALKVVLLLLSNEFFQLKQSVVLHQLYNTCMDIFVYMLFEKLSEQLTAGRKILIGCCREWKIRVKRQLFASLRQLHLIRKSTFSDIKGLSTAHFRWTNSRLHIYAVNSCNEELFTKKSTGHNVIPLLHQQLDFLTYDMGNFKWEYEPSTKYDKNWQFH